MGAKPMIVITKEELNKLRLEMLEKSAEAVKSKPMAFAALKKSPWAGHGSCGH